MVDYYYLCVPFTKVKLLVCTMMITLHASILLLWKNELIPRVVATGPSTGRNIRNQLTVLDVRRLNETTGSKTGPNHEEGKGRQAAAVQREHLSDDGFLSKH